MLKKLIILPVVIFIFFGLSFNAFSLEESDLSASGAVLYCPDNDMVIFEKNSEKRMSMASTTKIMTSLIALEQNTPDMEVTMTGNMVNVEGSSAGLMEGDALSLEELVYCMLLESGNEAANAVADIIGGNHKNFAIIMNSRAKEIGMKNTSFVTPSGLDDENHYTTAYDMALLTAEALRNERFASICASPSYSISFVNSDKEIKLYNHNRLLHSYNGCTGVKTGFTKKSGRCLVSSAVRDNITLIAVTLNAPDDWNDHIKMLDYGFSQYTSVVVDGDFSGYSVAVTGGKLPSVKIQSENVVIPIAISDSENVKRKIYTERFLYAPVKKGEIIGMAEYYSNNRLIRKIPLTASEDIEVKQQENNSLFDRLSGLFSR